MELVELTPESWINILKPVRVYDPSGQSEDIFYVKKYQYIGDYFLLADVRNSPTEEIHKKPIVIDINTGEVLNKDLVGWKAENYKNE